MRSCNFAHELEACIVRTRPSLKEPNEEVQGISIIALYRAQSLKMTIASTAQRSLLGVSYVNLSARL
jgi:hypothetical protein